MRIGKENIEEVIFDFHEGNLSDEGKADLMDFLHKHPEYEKEFMLWAKTYHTDKPLLDYGNDDRFLKKKYPSPLKWGTVVMVAGIVAAVVLWPKEKQVEQTPVLEKAEEVSVPIVAEKEEQMVMPAKVSQKRIASPVEEAVVPTVEAQADSVAEASAPEAPVLAKPDTVAKQEIPVLKEPQEVKKKPSVKSDSTIVHKKPKRKRKLNLTPTDNILPFNSDF